MKEKRQRAILDIIANHIIETQEQLLAELKERGFRCTQATISRDMKELQLIKELTPNGSYRYAVSIHQNRRDFNDRLRNVFREGVTSVDLAQNIIVLKTMPGLANAAAATSRRWWVPWPGTTRRCWSCAPIRRRSSFAVSCG